MTRKNTLLKIEHVTKEYLTGNKRTFNAVEDVSLSLEEGERLGIVGESGCGKSTLAKLIMNLQKPSSGEIYYRGEKISKLTGEALRRNRKYIQMVFQDPALAFSPRMRIKDILCEPLINFGGISKSQKTETAEKLLDMVGLDKSFLMRYPHNMSGGQRQRIAVARAIALEPEIIICDEATSALDVFTQNKMLDLLETLAVKNNIHYIFICHDVALAENFCNRMAVMYLGRVVELLSDCVLKRDALHPYTRMLLSSIFEVGQDRSVPLPEIRGEVSLEEHSVDQCIFQSRCPHAGNRCKTERPALREISENHWLACHRI